MYSDGLTLIEGSVATNLTVANGTAFPSSPSIGELFYRTDNFPAGLYTYNGTAWTAVGSGGGSGGGSSDNLVATGAVSQAASPSAVRVGIASGKPLVQVVNAAAGNGNKISQITTAANGTIAWELSNDTSSASAAFMSIARSGNTASNITLAAGAITLSAPVTATSVSASSFTGDGSGLTGLNASNIGSGTVDTARLGSGTANGTTFLSGDGTWKAISTSATSLAGTATMPYSSTTRGVYVGINSNTAPSVSWNNTSATAGQRSSQIQVLPSGDIRWNLSSDDMTLGSTFMQVVRSDLTATQITFTSNAFQFTGNTTVSGNLNVAVGSISGNGSGITSLNGSNISSGKVPAIRLGDGSPTASTFLAGDGVWRSVIPSTVNATSVISVSSTDSAFLAGINAGLSPLTFMVHAGASASNKVAYQSYLSNGALNIGFSTDAGSSQTPFLTATRNNGDVTTGSLLLKADAISLQGAVSATSISGNGAGLTNLDATKLVGIASPANLGFGTANTLTFLRGDGTWAVVSPTTLSGTGSIPTDVGTSGVYAGRLSGNSLFQIVNLSAPANNRVWDMRVDTVGSFGIGPMTDAASDLTYAFRIQRSGATASTITLESTNIVFSGTIQGNGAYTTTGAMAAASFTGNGSALTNLNANNIATGTVGTARLGSGTANNTTFLRGDGTWAAPVSTWNGGTVTAATTFTNTLSVKTVSGDVTVVAASNIDCSAGNYFTKTAAGALTWTASNVPASRFYSFVLRLTNGGTGAQTWFSNTKWEGGVAPTLTSAGVDILGFFTEDGGSTWYGVALSIDSK